ncbi:MAG: hypothetical protein WC755_02185 [Candidatus Woesearchaeota archaeon]|jgi:hypothetical protein
MNKIKYYKSIKSILDQFPMEEPFIWLRKYPIYHKNRIHLFDIIKDICLNIKSGAKIIEQGSAEAISLRVLKDKGYSVFAVDININMKLFWDKLDIPGTIGDCTGLEWWNGELFNVIIATVWTACDGPCSSKLTEKKKERLSKIRDNWMKILDHEGIIYFDINPKKYHQKEVRDIFGQNFVLKVLSTRNARLLFKGFKK